MTEATMDTSAVVRDITVAVPIQRAWDVFTRDFSTWWPSAYSIGTEPMETCVIEPREGGRWYERSASGSECEWGRVLSYDPPQRLVLSWGISADWSVEPDASNHSEIEVTFTAAGDSSTRVELVHRGFERHSAAGYKVRDVVSSGGGWGSLLEQYAQATQRSGG